MTLLPCSVDIGVNQESWWSNLWWWWWLLRYQLLLKDLSSSSTNALTGRYWYRHRSSGNQLCEELFGKSAMQHLILKMITIIVIITLINTKLCVIIIIIIIRFELEESLESMLGVIKVDISMINIIKNHHDQCYQISAWSILSNIIMITLTPKYDHHQ